jgi:peptidoglycan/xylan/chitin deacetylase (PgdA/CDA1 family)
MTRYIAAYDTESIDQCLPAVERLVELHHRYEIPATFFIVGRLLERDGARYRELLDDPLFDVQTHSWSHQILKDSIAHGPGVSLEQMEIEVHEGKRWVEEVFERECIGFRPGCGFVDGFTGVPERLEILRRNGIRFTSADLRGPMDSIPNDMQQPYTYEKDGYGDIWEIPGHGWHDNVLKWGSHITYYPPVYDFAAASRNAKTVVECFGQEGRWLEHAVELGLRYVSLVQHPWSLRKFDENLATTELLLIRARQLGMECTTYLSLYQELAAGK